MVRMYNKTPGAPELSRDGLSCITKPRHPEPIES